MKIQNIFFVLIVAVVIALPCRTIAEKTVTESPPAGISNKDKPSTVSVKAYYFHRTQRCKTCYAIEADTKKALKTGFPKEMAQGIITWQAVNIDQEDNKHFEKDFDLMFSSVILVKYKNGKPVEWKNLQKVWELVWKGSAFEEYVQKEMKAYLER